VRAIEPHTEADQAALLVHFLVAFGNIIGRGAFYIADGAEHHGNCFALIVGKTAIARKGTAWRQIENLFSRLEDRWVILRQCDGVGSGEGVIDRVRDPVMKGSTLVDEGATDKRLLICETEFYSILAVNKREGNTASVIIRKAWESGILQTTTRKDSSLRATGAHISIIGHITAEELRRHLDQIEVSNGFMNRFLICCAKRSKELPEGGSISKEDIGALARELAVAVEFGQGSREFRRDEEARKLWREIYHDLSDVPPGLFGSLIARAAPQVLRLSMLYALLDCSEVIRRGHLEAARSVWRYCEDSARYVFGDALGDPVADEILRALRDSPDGLTRTQISELFGRNRKASEILRALSVLLHHGFANSQTEATEGRTIERWFAKRRTSAA